MNLANKPIGTQDIYPPRSLLYQKIQQLISEILQKNNYQPIVFPTFEHAELFTNSLGLTTDVIHKEMYVFVDKGGRNLALRPEGTASTVRLVCQNNLVQEGYPLKFYYWANMFRYERPQKGRYREFWQLGVELINTRGVLADYQILRIIVDILRSLAITDFTFSLNYIGDENTKKNYKKTLETFLGKNISALCQDCQRRQQTNPLRILDCLLCKEKFSFPPYKNAWSSQDKNYVKEINELLDNFNIPYQYDYYLVRGLDYYTGLVFEVILTDKKALLGGGRYDKLYQQLGNIDLPAIGFAVGIERLVDYLTEQKLLQITNKIDIFFFVSATEFYSEMLLWKDKLAKYSLTVDYNLEIRKLKKLVKIIDYYQPRLIIILGQKELTNQKILIKDCEKEQEFLVEKENLIKWIYNYLTIKK